MQRNDLAALAAGVSVGVTGGALGALLAHAVGVAALHRLLGQGDDQSIELRRLVGPTARQGDPQTGLRDAPAAPPIAPPASAKPLPLPLPPVESTAAATWPTADRLVAVPRT